MRVELEGVGDVEIPENVEAVKVAKEYLPGERFIAAEIDGIEQDLLTARISEGSRVSFIPPGSAKGRAILRHSTAHVLAQAVTNLFPGAKYAIGPSIVDGFYYDFDLPDGRSFEPADIEAIEARMRVIMKEGQRFLREDHTLAEGKALFADQPYKLEIISKVESADATEEDIEEGAGEGGVSIYRNSSGWIDLCKGPHVPSTSSLGHFKLMRIAGAYWRGSEKNPQLQRIYGTAWESKEALASYLHRLEEAERRDHRKLGLEMDLFHFPPEIGSGLPVFHPKGAMIRYLMEEFSRREHLKAGYEFAWTPHVTKSTLYEISGHLSWYKDGMFPEMELEGATYHMKPMNCPMHILIYGARARSYRELPLRLFEFGTVYRYERSGVLHGLARVRGLTQDDSHIFCRPEQLPGEITSVLAFVLNLLRAFGLEDFEAELATRPEKSTGTDEEWDYATAALKSAMEGSGIPYRIAEGEGAFYAPKIDIHLTDAIGRRWQVSTLQVDLQMPQRFDMTFNGPENAKERPYMIHRALFGSVERFLAILIEHYAGALPTWLSPVQAIILPVSESVEEYAQELAAELRSRGARVEMLEAKEPLGSRVRRAKLDKVPFVLVVGETDRENATVGVNRRGEDRPDRDVPLQDFLAEFVKDAATPVLRGAL